MSIHTAAVRQPIYGFGGTQTYNGDALLDFSNRDAVYKALFADLKLDILRLRNYHDYAGQQEGFDKTTREFALGALKYSDPVSRGGKAPVRLMFTSWSPPAYLKSNNLVSGKSDGTDKGLDNATLKKDSSGKYMYAGFADWWLASLKKFKDLVGVLPDFVAIQNELDLSISYEGCRFLPSEGRGSNGFEFAGYDQALEAVHKRITESFGKQAPKIVGPETFTIRIENSGRDHLQEFLDPATPEGKGVLKNLFGISYHIYGSGTNDADKSKFPRALESVRKAFNPDGKGYPIFQTEFLEGNNLTDVASYISDTMTVGGASAYMVWISARNAQGPGFALVYFNPYDGSVERRERFYAVKHFSAFVGEGWSRVEADCSDPSLKLSAFVGPKNAQLVTVVVNPSGQPVKIEVKLDDPNWLKAGSNLFRTVEGEGGERWRDLGPLPNDRIITLPPKSVVTVRLDKNVKQ